MRIFRALFLGAVTATALAGCASQIMEGYVGRDITEVMIDYGQPSNVFKLPDGRVAFQWTDTNTIYTPTTTDIYSYGNYATATTYGGTASDYECVYTIFARPNRNGSHTVVGFKEPNLMCE